MNASIGKNMEISNTFSANKRNENRIAINSVNLPFLGTRESDQACFQYLLLDVSLHGARIAIPQWVVNRELIKQDDLVNFHIPFQFNKKYFDQGSIAWSRWDDALQANAYGASFNRESPALYPVFISFETSEISISLQDFPAMEDILVKVLKDSVLLKKGILIYLRHLIPYFSRITKYSPKDYPLLKEFMLDDVRNRILEHLQGLEAIYGDVCEKVRNPSEIPKFIDLESLRTLVESEIHQELFQIAFASESIKPYILAIKKLEKKLCYNYNTVVMIYIRSLG